MSDSYDDSLTNENGSDVNIRMRESGTMCFEYSKIPCFTCDTSLCLMILQRQIAMTNVLLDLKNR